MAKMTTALISHPRLAASAVLGVAVYLMLGLAMGGSLRLIVAWDAFAICYLALAFAVITRSSDRVLRQRAAAEDDGRWVVLGMCVIAAIASLTTTIFLVAGITDSGSKAIHIALAGATVFLSWLFVHVTFAIHYAHEYFALGSGQSGKEGLDFPGTGPPDYWDFLYFSIAIGTAAATSDVNVTSQRMRRLVTFHSAFAFFFNAAIVGLSVNIAASLI